MYVNNYGDLSNINVAGIHNIAKFVIFKYTQMEPCSSLAKDGPICVIPYSANNSVSVKWFISANPSVIVYEI